MHRNKTLTDINNLMERIGCFNKSNIDNRLHEAYLRENVEDEDKYVEPVRTANAKPHEVDKNNVFTAIEIEEDHSILYAATKQELVQSLMNNGPSVEFVGKGAGTYVWGKGVYSNYQMNQPFYRTVSNKGLYGAVLIKMLYRGNLMKECLIAEKGVGRTEPLSQQIKRFRGLDQYLQEKGVDFKRLDYLTDKEYYNSSSSGLRVIIEKCGGYRRAANVLLGFGVQGILFYGNNDKPVVVVYNANKLKLLGYIDNTNKHGHKGEHDIQWTNVPEDKGGGQYINHIDPYLEYFKDEHGKRIFYADPKITREHCGEIIVQHKQTKRYAFLDVEKANEMINNLTDGDPRLFGDIEFAKCIDFENKNGRELAQVKMESDDRSLYIDKQGNLFLTNKPNERPFSTIYDYYGEDDIVDNNDIPMDDDDFDFDWGNIDLEKQITEQRVEHNDGHVELDNFDLARKIMKFNGPDDAYFIKIAERHKDHMDRKYEHDACDYKGFFEIVSIEHLNAVEPVIKKLCQYGEWRAMMYINPRSMVATRKFANDVLRPRFKKHNSHMQGHEIEVAYGQSKSGIDRTGKDWDSERPLCFIDVDNDDPNIHQQVLDYIDNMGLKPLEMYKTTNNGLHIILPDVKQARKLDFSFLDNGKQGGKWATAGMEEDKSITLYAYVKPNGYGVQKRMQQRLGLK